MIPSSRPLVPREDADFTVSAGAGGSDVRYSLRQLPFTLNCLQDLMSEMSMDLPSNNSKTMHRPSHHERSFRGKSLRWEL